jgi:hypothetical protein
MASLVGRFIGYFAVLHPKKPSAIAPQKAAWRVYYFRIAFESFQTVAGLTCYNPGKFPK